MPLNDGKRAYSKDLLLSSAMVAAGLVIFGLSVFQLNVSNPHAPNHQMAQATQPLQSTPGAESKPFAPAEPAATGARPHEISPEPARPDADALKAGAERALPPAPPEKIAPPIKGR